MLVLNFFLFRILPGDPERTLTRLQRSSPSTIEAVKKELGLDRPLTVQFFDYLGDTARGELGISYDGDRDAHRHLGRVAQGERGGYHFPRLRPRHLRHA